jgi:hypothetical protein
MAAYGAEVILSESMETARDMLLDMEKAGLGHCLDQYNNEDNTDSHYLSTGEGGGGGCCAAAGRQSASVGFGRWGVGFSCQLQQ